MKISAKGRYALAAMTHIAYHYHSKSPITVLSIAERLGISKIYLEQVFSALKRAGIVRSIKGAQGGYQLTTPPDQITVYHILRTSELTLFEENDNTVEKAPALDKTLKELVFSPLDTRIDEFLQSITLQELLNETEKNLNSSNDLMYFI